MVACPEAMYKDIKKLTDALEEAAKNWTKLWMATPSRSKTPFAHLVNC
jgi:hypothetical protein